MLDTAIVLAIISLVGTIITGILQFRKDKAEINKSEAEVKKIDMDALGNITELALKFSQQEFDTLRKVNEVLTARNSFLTTQLEICQQSNADKLAKISELKDQLNEQPKSKGE